MRIETVGDLKQRCRMNEETGCWEWTRCALPSGYGRGYINGRYQYTHRLAYQLTYGEIKRGFHICHSCDNPRCCNPEHLWMGTAAENVADRDAKGRHRAARGPACGSVRLTPNQVREIRRSYPQHTYEQLGAIHGVAKATIQAVINGRTWSWLED